MINFHDDMRTARANQKDVPIDGKLEENLSSISTKMALDNGLYRGSRVDHYLHTIFLCHVIEVQLKSITETVFQPPRLIHNIFGKHAVWVILPIRQKLT